MDKTASLQLVHLWKYNKIWQVSRSARLGIYQSARSIETIVFRGITLCVIYLTDSQCLMWRRWQKQWVSIGLLCSNISTDASIHLLNVPQRLKPTFTLSAQNLPRRIFKRTHARAVPLQLRHNNSLQKITLHGVFFLHIVMLLSDFFYIFVWI